MFLSAIHTYVVFIIIAVVLVQYAFAIFCLLKLAYMDLSKNKYILWNLFILIVFFIGGAVFLVYYYKHPELRLGKDFDQLIEHTDPPVPADDANNHAEQAEPAVEEKAEQPAEQAEPAVEEKAEQPAEQAEPAVEEKAEQPAEQAEPAVEEKAEQPAEQAEPVVEEKAEQPAEQAEPAVEEKAEQPAEQAEPEAIGNAAVKKTAKKTTSAQPARKKSTGGQGGKKPTTARSGTKTGGNTKKN